ncbi:MAG: hypothetical protein DMG12_09365 [Acidobacteria bacterium]|nr:MAG: hypothetical protein DMG12_09365 [Acidobacteriota bacterium]
MRLRNICLLLLFFLCASEVYAQTSVTFDNQVVRIFQQHCQTCHRPGNISPLSLLTYVDARSHAFEILNAVQTRQMPPWKPVNAHGVFRGERYLTDEEIETISRWVSDGVQEGAPRDLPEPISFPETWAAGVPDVVVEPGESYSVTAGSDDIYRCFTMMVDSRSDIYVRGGFLTGLGAVGGWVPGASPEMFPLGNGVRIPAGARVVMQVHYSTAQAAKTSDGPLDPDRTRVGFYLSPASLQSVTFLPVVNPFFAITPGDSHYQVKASVIIPADVELVAIAPHMHLLGREATVEARFPNGQRRQLIRIDDWDFRWQGNYFYNEPITLPAGTVVEMTAYYDNSLNNPKNPSNPPVMVRWGERTVDEMCLTFISVRTPGIPSLNVLPFSVTDRGTTSVITQGSSGATQVGYARVSDSSGGSPSGLAILSYRQNGTLVGEASVPASALLTRGRIAAQATSIVRTGLAIANPNNEAAAVSFFFTDASGNDVGSGSTNIPANGQIAAFLDEAPFNGASTFTGSFSFSSSTPVSVVALRGLVNERSEFLITTLPVADLSSSTSTAATVFPHFADGGGWTSEIILVNPTDSTISGTLRFADPLGKPLPVNLNGQAGTSFGYSIPLRSARQFLTAGSSDVVRVGPVSIVPSEDSIAPTGSLVFSYSKSNIRVTEAGVAASAAGTAFRVYVEASTAVQSGLAITNTSSTPATVRLDVFDLSGASVAGTTLTLAGNAQLANFLSEISGFQALSLPVQGLLRITGTSPVAVVGLRGRNNERGDFLITTTPPVPESTASSASEMFFPHFADANGYTTQFIVFSSGAGHSLNGSVRFFSQSGQPLDVKLK